MPSKKKKAKIIFVLAHSFEPFFQRVKEDINNIRELDHFTTRYIDFMQNKSDKYEFELWVLSSRIKKPLSIMHKKGFLIRVFPRDIPSFLPLETSRSLLKEMKKLCLENLAERKKKGEKACQDLIWHMNSYYIIISDPILWILRKYKQKVIIHHRGGGFTLKGLPYSIYKYGIMNPIMLRRADLILAENKDEKRRLVQYYRLNPGKIIYAPNPVPVERAKTDIKQIKKELKMPPDKTIITYAGRFELVKKVYPFMKEFWKQLKKHDDIFMILIGEGREKRKVEELIKEKSVQNIRLIGWLGKKELIKYLQVTDVFVHPNNKSEGTPNALIEVQGVGIPIVGFDIEGVRDIVTDEVNGYLEHTKDMRKFSEKIISLAKRKDLIAKMKVKARENYETNYNPDKIFRVYEEVYESLK